MCAKSVIAESNHYIVLDEYTEYRESNTAYQTEADLEREFVADLKKQGYEYLNLKSPADLLVNLRRQLEAFNNVVFSDAEWERLLTEYLDNPSDTLIEKTEKLHHDDAYQFRFDDGREQNIPAS